MSYQVWRASTTLKFIRTLTDAHSDAVQFLTCSQSIHSNRDNLAFQMCDLCWTAHVSMLGSKIQVSSDADVCKPIKTKRKTQTATNIGSEKKKIQRAVLCFILRIQIKHCK